MTNPYLPNSISCYPRPCILYPLRLEQWFSMRGDFVPGDIWQRLQSFLVVPVEAGAGGEMLLLIRRWLIPEMLLNISQRIRQSPTTQNYASYGPRWHSLVSRLRSPGLQHCSPQEAAPFSPSAAPNELRPPREAAPELLADLCHSALLCT